MVKKNPRRKRKKTIKRSVDKNKKWRNHYAPGFSYNRIVTRSQTACNRIEGSYSNLKLMSDSSYYNPPNKPHLIIALKGLYGHFPRTVVTRSFGQKLSKTKALCDEIDEYKKLANIDPKVLDIPKKEFMEEKMEIDEVKPKEELVEDKTKEDKVEPEEIAKQEFVEEKMEIDEVKPKEELVEDDIKEDKVEPEEIAKQELVEEKTEIDEVKPEEDLVEDDIKENKVEPEETKVNDEIIDEWLHELMKKVRK